MYTGMAIRMMFERERIARDLEISLHRLLRDAGKRHYFVGAREIMMF